MAEAPRTVMSDVLGRKLVEAGLLDSVDGVRRVILDLQADKPARMYVERYTDERWLDVFTAADGLEVITHTEAEDQGLRDVEKALHSLRAGGWVIDGDQLGKPLETVCSRCGLEIHRSDRDPDLYVTRHGVWPARCSNKPGQKHVPLTIDLSSTVTTGTAETEAALLAAAREPSPPVTEEFRAVFQRVSDAWAKQPHPGPGFRRWVMDLATYREIRRANNHSHNAQGLDPVEQDEEKWFPLPEDQLYASPIRLADDGTELHVELVND
jgi:hypothetical protein